MNKNKINELFNSMIDDVKYIKLKSSVLKKLEQFKDK